MIGAQERGLVTGELESKPVLFGITASNLANVHNPELRLPTDAARLTTMLSSHDLGIEMQFEGIPAAEIPVFPKPAFLGIHQPIVGVDLANPSLRDESFQKLFTAMETTATVGAEYLTLHMQTNDYWEDLGHREERVQGAFSDVDVLANHYRERGYGFQMLIENVEFPKFPATMNELVRVVDYIKQFPDVPFGIALDFGHLWHSGYLELENLWRPELGSIADGWGRQMLPFGEYLEDTLRTIQEDLALIHLTGCFDHKTHELPGTIPGDRGNVIPDRGYNGNEMDIRNAVLAIAKNAQGSARQSRVINEAMGYPYEAIITNTLILREMERTDQASS